MTKKYFSQYQIVFFTKQLFHPLLLKEQICLQVQYCIISSRKMLPICAVEARTVTFVTKYQLLFWTVEQLRFITGWCFSLFLLQTHNVSVTHYKHNNNSQPWHKSFHVSATWAFFLPHLCVFFSMPRGDAILFITATKYYFRFLLLRLIFSRFFWLAAWFFKLHLFRAFVEFLQKMALRYSAQHSTAICS